MMKVSHKKTLFCTISSFFSSPNFVFGRLATNLSGLSLNKDGELILSDITISGVFNSVTDDEKPLRNLYLKAYLDKNDAKIHIETKFRKSKTKKSKESKHTVNHDNESESDNLPAIFFQTNESDEETRAFLSRDSKKKVTLAKLSFDDSIEENGWATLSADIPKKQAHSHPELAMYAAGFLEGAGSTKRMQQFRHNANALLERGDTEHHALPNIRTMFTEKIKNIISMWDKLGTNSNSDSSNALSGPGKVSQSMQQHVPENLIQANSTMNSDSDKEFWRQARYALFQTLGIRDGFNKRRQKNEPEMSLVDIMLMSSDGETPELQVAYDMKEFLMRQESESDSRDSDSGSDSTSTSFLQLKRKNIPVKTGTLLSQKQSERKHILASLNDKKWREIQRKTGRCSALIRMTEDNLFIGHTTFSDYTEMLRVFKYYNFPLPGAASNKMGFSSYPGIAGSTDDYYLLDTGLAVTETTISMLSDSPYDKIDEKAITVPDFMRIMLANRLAKTGSDWIDIMKKSATGTYSSQWMVVDTNKFKPNGKSEPNMFLVLDQAPNSQHSEDMTNTLKTKGYWSSYNRAWFDDVRDAIGVTKAESDHGILFSKDKSPRANIFRATAPDVMNLMDMRHEMQRNRWPNEIDGGESNTPDHAIAARSDIDTIMGFPNGAVDSKVADIGLIKKLQCSAISGPTTDNGRLKPFSWVEMDSKTSESDRDLYPGTPREGLPLKWNFDWVTMKPNF